MSNENNQVNIDDLSLDELRQLAEQEAAANQQSNGQPDGGQPRNEKGQFVKAEEANGADQQDEQLEDEPTGEPDSKIYRRVIDVGGDAGAEVFEAESLEELVDKIAEAKKHATKKIRDQEAELRKLRTEQPKEKEFTADEEFVISQELLAKPTQAFKKMFKEITGASPEEFAQIKQNIDAQSKAQAASGAANQFLASHPDFIDSPKNGKLMNMALKGSEVTLENLNKAYIDLKNSGLLELKDEKAHDGQEPTSQPEQRISEKAEAEVPPQRIRKASGLSTRTRNTVTPRSTEPTEQDLYSMPLEQLKELAMRQQK